MNEILGQMTPGMRFADLHMHSDRYHGVLSPESIVDIAEDYGHLASLAITEHGMVQPSIDARNYAQDKGYELEVISGAEIRMERAVHLIGLYLEKDVPSSMSFPDTIKAIHAQNGLAILPHPLYRRLRRLKAGDFVKLFRPKDQEVYLDGFEVYSAGANTLSPQANQNALRFYQKFGRFLGAVIGSSDGHGITSGRGVTGFEGDLRTAILDRKTAVFSTTVEEDLMLVSHARSKLGKDFVPARSFRGGPSRKLSTI
jgi:predicted metal-dependent phosphoesterase TrpH